MPAIFIPQNDFILWFQNKGAIITKKAGWHIDTGQIDNRDEERYRIMFIVLAGGLLIIIFAVVVSVVSSVVSAVAADSDESTD